MDHRWQVRGSKTTPDVQLPKPPWPLTAVTHSVKIAPFRFILGRILSPYLDDQLDIIGQSNHVIRSKLPEHALDKCS